MKKTIRGLILDMGGVLTLPQREDKVRELMGVMGQGGGPEPFLAAYYEKRREYDRGDLDRRAYWTGVAEALGAPPPGPAIDELARVDLESWFNMRPRMIELVRALRARSRALVLLSNIHHDGARYVRSGEGRAWSSAFDELVLSCEHRLAKPEAEIYGIAVRAANASAGECLFVDDSEANVEGARRAGLESFRFVDEADFEERLERDYALAR